MTNSERSDYEPVDAVNLVNDILDALDFSRKTMPIDNAENLLKRAVKIIDRMQERIEELDDYYRP